MVRSPPAEQTQASIGWSSDHAHHHRQRRPAPEREKNAGQAAFVAVLTAAAAAGSHDSLTGSHDLVMGSHGHPSMMVAAHVCGGGVAVAGTGDLGSSPKTGRRGYAMVRGDHDEGSTSGHSWR